MASPYQGGQALGEAIFGGRNRGNSDVFVQRLKQNFDAKRAMEEADNSRVQRIAREAITAADIEAARSGDTAAAARLGEAALRTADTPNLRNITGGFADFDEAGYRRGAVEKARLGDMVGAQAELVGLANGPLKVNTIDGGYQLNNYEVGGAAVATPGELANIALRQARVGTEGARQGELAAKAEAAATRANKPSAALETLQWQVEALESDLGRKLSAQELADLKANKLKIEVPSPAALPSGDPTSVRWIEGGQETMVPLGQVAKAPAKAAPKSTSTGKPKVGEVRKGYRYTGGDPASRSAWVKI